MDIFDAVDDAFKFEMRQQPDEVKAFAGFLLGAQVGSALEIGTYAGGFTKFLANILPPDSLIITMDDNSYYTYQPDSLQWKIKQICSWGSNIHYVEGNSHNAVSLNKVKQILGDRSLDLLFIDGDHSYEGCRFDFEMYKSLVRPGKWIAIHDLTMTEEGEKIGYGCHIFFNELRGKKIRICQPGATWGGIGIVQV